MNDRELLELAAKAAGYQVEWVKNSGCYYRCEEEIGREQWDPLEDDGDALRLAVKLRLDIMFFEGFQEVHSSHCYADRPECLEEYGEDIMASTRRAIVRAAAEIGKSLEEEND